MLKPLNSIETSRARLAPMLAIVLAAAGLCACSTAPIERSGLPAAPVAFKEGNGLWTTAAPADAQPRGTWWKAFSDPLLDDLVERAGRSNTSIQLATARLAQARALVSAARAGLFPQLGARTGVTRQGGPLINAAGGEGTLVTAAADLSYEL
ncbi:MAG: hypothetical protein JWO70_323, partial [Betaproteobacteria bacterium]|nr:hypothetical protein [Betaproteobacteria bacterium]